jgi:TolA-binding protein
MNVSQLCPDDLLLAARQGSLNPRDEARLDFHLARCGRCRAALDVGRAFDLDLQAQTFDDAIATRIAAAITRRPRRKWPIYAFAAGALFGGSVAVAAVAPHLKGYWERTRELFESNAASDANSGEHAGVKHGAETKPVTSEPLLPAPSITSNVDAPAIASAELAAASAHSPSRSANVSEGGARALFSEANGLRSHGDASAARARYLELQARYPDSSEARVSLVSLGRLELSVDPKTALAHFDAYLRRADHGTLTEEALFGRASALQRLGRTREERSTWQQLLDQFPSSIYRQRATSRLSMTQ